MVKRPAPNTGKICGYDDRVGGTFGTRQDCSKQGRGIVSSPPLGQMKKRGALLDLRQKGGGRLGEKRWFLENERARRLRGSVWG